MGQWRNTIRLREKPNGEVVAPGDRGGGRLRRDGRAAGRQRSCEDGRLLARAVWPRRRQGSLPLQIDQRPRHGSASDVVRGDDRVAARAGPQRAIRRCRTWVRHARRLSGARAILRRGCRAVRQSDREGAVHARRDDLSPGDQ